MSVLSVSPLVTPPDLGYPFSVTPFFYYLVASVGYEPAPLRESKLWLERFVADKSKVVALKTLGHLESRSYGSKDLLQY